MPSADPTRRRSLRAPCALLVALALLAPACVTPATEIVVVLDSNAPLDRALELAVTVRRGAGTGGAGETRRWVRVAASELDAGAPDAGRRDGGAAALRDGGVPRLPVSFGVIPGPAGGRDDLVTIVAEATQLAGPRGEPGIAVRRTARVRFTGRRTVRIVMYLPFECGVPANGCRSVPPERCTRSVLCEERELTCGPGGTCVTTMISTEDPLDASACGAPGRCNERCPCRGAGEVCSPEGRCVPAVSVRPDAGAACRDDDGDGAPAAAGPGCDAGAALDCDDRNPAVRPGAPEVCNRIDDDCDGVVDQGGAPITCGVGACARSVPGCVAGVPGMCVPGTPAAESCNGLDDNCDGVADNGLGQTACGVGACRRTVEACAGGRPGMCVPGAPGAEVCNGVDDNCDGAIDEGFGAVTCGVGACQRTVSSCAMGAGGMCVPGAPGAEVCNGVDDNCNGATDEGLGSDTCGVGECERTAARCVGGRPNLCVPGPPTGEVCNGRDDNCDGAVDNGLGSITCGVGACQRTVARCVGGVPQACTPGAPDCGSRVCGDDGCGGSCGSCALGFECNASGQCVCGPAPSWQMAGGACRPSCGVALGIDGYNDNGTGCCSTGCIGRESSRATYDCAHCCEGVGAMVPCL